MRGTIRSTALALVFFFIPLKAFPASQSTAVHLEWVQLQGRVLEKDAAGRKLVIQDRRGNVTRIQLTDSVQIFRSWRLTDFESIKPRDSVILKNRQGHL